jgi:hypothetical protein
MKRWIGVMLITCCTMAGAVECNKDSSKQVLAMMLEFAKWDQSPGSAMNVYLNKKTKGRSAADRQKLVEGFANAQACLTGSPIRMNFYFGGRLIADATPEHGVRMLNAGT